MPTSPRFVVTAFPVMMAVMVSPAAPAAARGWHRMPAARARLNAVRHRR